MADGSMQINPKNAAASGKGPSEKKVWIQESVQ
jgi:hypothetical protein